HDGSRPRRDTNRPRRDEDCVIRLCRGAHVETRVARPAGRRMGRTFLEATQDAVLPTGYPTRREEDDAYVWTYPHAPTGAVRVRLTPEDGEPVFLRYVAAEGAEVSLEANFD
ncbi:MAG: hypothetical protein ACC662_11950, partial [Planctomycetota bacterium]